MKRHYWTDKEVEILNDLYSDLPTVNIAHFLSIEIKSVYAKANSMGLKKSTEYLNSSYSGRLTVERRNKDTQFKPGMTPWNKGMKGLSIGGINSQYKPGNKPHNTKYNGAISIRNDTSGIGYKYIRIDEAKWKLLHHKVWIEHNGPIPEGMIIAFKNGDTFNCDIDNLVMISREENMIRNSIHRYPEEIVSAIRTRQMLNKQIKKISNG